MDNIRLCKEILKKINHISGTFLFICLLNALCKSMKSFVPLVFATILIDKIVVGVGFAEIIPFAIVCIVLPQILNIISAILEHQIAVKSRKIENGLDQSVNQVLISINYEELENPEILNELQMLEEAKNMVGSLTGIIQVQITGLLTNAWAIIVCVPILFQMIRTDYLPIQAVYFDTIPDIVGKIASCSGIYLFFILILCMVSVGIKYNMERRKQQITKNFVNVERAYGYYTSLIADYENGADIRLNGLSSLIEKKREDYKKNEKKMFFTLGKEDCVSGIKLTFIARIEVLFSYLIIVCKILCGMISIGELYLYTNIILQFVDNMSEFFQQISEIRVAFSYYKVYPLLWNLKQTEKKENDVAQINCSEPIIEFKGVSFHYPGNPKWIVHDLNFSIAQNEKVALVGPNGAGKSTLIKLLMGLYEPQKGTIRICGRDIRSYDKEKLYALYSVVFQKNHFLASTIGNNVTSTETYEAEKVRDLLQTVGLEECLGQKGEQTQFSRYLSQDGKILSGGEEQKLAIARMLYKNAPIFIMDEPTASLDPVSEKELNEKMAEISQDHTSVIISHRLSNCCNSDRIIVLRKGEIVEEGKHDQLLKQNGLYAMMWKIQAQYYLHYSTEEKSVNAFL